MTTPLDGIAIVYCEKNFATPNGKTAHGLVRFTNRYEIAAVIDSTLAGNDAGEFLDGKPNGIPIVANVDEAMKAGNLEVSHFVLGLAPDGGRLPNDGRLAVKEAMNLGLNVDSGLHDFLSEDAELSALAEKNRLTIRDIRRPPHRNDLHFFTGKIEEVTALKIAILGTDSAVGKRTTAWKIVEGFQNKGISAELAGTGQTAWMQGAKYSFVLDSVVNDFVAGEIEHAVWSAWKEGGAKVVVVEGQGSLMNPAYPGGFEIMAAARPDIIVVQHAPARKAYDGFPDYPVHPLDKQLEVIRLIGEKPVAAITLNHEELEAHQIPDLCRQIETETGLPVFDVLVQGPEGLVDCLANYLQE
jgi:uncharacterized NAD-dependent epimerase/dehydratase family protein